MNEVSRQLPRQRQGQCHRPEHAKAEDRESAPAWMPESSAPILQPRAVIALTHQYSACRALEDENRKLKKLLAESMLDRVAFKELLKTEGPAAERDAVAHLRSVLGDERTPGPHPRYRRSQDGPLSLPPPRRSAA
jgi:hypothetical protein